MNSGVTNGVKELWLRRIIGWQYELIRWVWVGLSAVRAIYSIKLSLNNFWTKFGSCSLKLKIQNYSNPSNFSQSNTTHTNSKKFKRCATYFNEKAFFPFFFSHYD
jgi:hypothetical protein